jgi:hypothetical protein
MQQLFLVFLQSISGRDSGKRKKIAFPPEADRRRGLATRQ